MSEAKKPAVKCEWVSIHDRLPEKYVEVLTLMYSGGSGHDVCTNSIHGRHHRNPDGSLLELYEWSNEPLRVTHWLDGVPEFPQRTQNHSKAEAVE